MDPLTISALAAAIPGLFGMFSKNNDSRPPYEQEMKKLLSMQMGQMQQADPLRQALLAWSQGLVPKPYQPQQSSVLVPGQGGRPPMGPPERDRDRFLGQRGQY